jgi:hypothetical protein
MPQKGRRSRLDPLAALLTGTAAEAEDAQDRPDLLLTDRRLEAVAKWRANAWDFLTGDDPDTGRPVYWTQDERDSVQPFKPYPKHLDYLHYLVDLLDNEEKLAIEKSSQMIVTTTILGHSAWDCGFHDGVRVMLSKHKEAEAEALIRDKLRTPWRLLPEWVRHNYPLLDRPANLAAWPKQGGLPASLLWGLTENAAAAELRGNTYRRALLDEAEWQDNLPALITAATPRCGQLVMWSTPAEAGLGAHTFRKYL